MEKEGQRAILIKERLEDRRKSRTISTCGLLATNDATPTILGISRSFELKARDPCRALSIRDIWYRYLGTYVLLYSFEVNRGTKYTYVHRRHSSFRMGVAHVTIRDTKRGQPREVI